MANCLKLLSSSTNFTCYHFINMNLKTTWRWILIGASWILPLSSHKKKIIFFFQIGFRFFLIILFEFDFFSTIFFLNVFIMTCVCEWPLFDYVIRLDMVFNTVLLWCLTFGIVWVYDEIGLDEWNSKVWHFRYFTLKYQWQVLSVKVLGPKRRFF